MNITGNSIIGELAAQDYRTAPVFQSFGIDFCCKGNRSLDEVCNIRGLELPAVLGALEKATQVPDQVKETEQIWPLDQLADHIIERHHRYVETRIPEISSFLHKIVQVHGSAHPELAEIEQLFLASAGELTLHMKKEELILFPRIKKMANAQREKTRTDSPPFGTVGNPIAMMRHEHDTEGERFREISHLSNAYTPPKDACNTYRVTFGLLHEFETDLHRHIHLENNILFTKALELEKQLNG